MYIFLIFYLDKGMAICEEQWCRTKEKMRLMADAEERREFYNCEVIPSQTRVCASYVYANEAGADQPLVTHVKQRICIYESESYLYLNYVYL